MAVTPVVLALSRSGENVAAMVAEALDAPLHGRQGRVKTADVWFDNALDHARDLFAAGIPIVGVCASGILIRGVAPLLQDKKIEPPVVSVSEDGTVVVPLLGGHRGANRIARDLARALDAKAAVTTAGDIGLGVSLDEPPAGWRLVEGDPKAVVAGLLHGRPARLQGQADWIKPLTQHENCEISSESVRVAPNVEGLRLDVEQAGHLLWVPQQLALGLGCARGVSPTAMWAHVEKVLSEQKIDASAIACVSTIDLKGDEPAIIETSERLGVPLRLFSPEELEQESPRLANPSDVVYSEVGCHGVAEGAALASVGDSATLVVEKVKSADCTAAIAFSPVPMSRPFGRPRGRLSILGIGPGQSGWRTPEVSQLISDADILVGYGLYIDLLGATAKGKERADFPLGGEEARCRYALEEAGKGRDVALICSGDAGIYAMGALVFELLDRGADEQGVSDAARRVEVLCSPGVSALQAAAARAGAPLGHDFCAISLSDLLTPRADILQRLKAASQGDFVVAFYNPVSKTRRTLLAEARDILLQHRPADTPVLLATSLGRPEELIRYRRLEDLNVDEVDMLTVVLVGSSNSRIASLGEGPRMYTPRGYARKIDGDLSQKGSC